jgi:threonylcarbamoyladenosine tRNA methylthiotransferase MtaB
MKVAITTLGCKANQYDSWAMEEALARGGLTVVEFPEPADAYVINTCTVTGKTDYQSRQLIRRARRTNPDATIVVTGCYAEVNSKEVLRVEGVDYVLGNPGKGEVLEYILRGRPSNGPETAPGPSPDKATDGVPMTLRARGSSNRTRASLKLQDGCDRRCTYCIIPRARGVSRSLPLGDVEREIDAFVAHGYKEIVLTGIHLGAYGEDLSGQTGLTTILRLIEKRRWPCRFRISSLDPDEVTDELIEILKTSESICNHMHLPLQSGSKAILKSMGRNYTPGAFADVVWRLFKAVPGVAIGTDIIAGFPGEGAAEFDETYDMVRDLPLSYLHIFPFSVRDHTPAAAYPGVVAKRTVKDRCRRLKELNAVKRNDFYKRFVGSTATVLVESSRDKHTGLAKGKSKNYIPVLLEHGAPDRPVNNTIVRARLTGVLGASMTGTVFSL